jgi:hypothetical protein
LEQRLRRLDSVEAWLFARLFGGDSGRNAELA